MGPIIPALPNHMEPGFVLALHLVPLLCGGGGRWRGAGPLPDGDVPLWGQCRARHPTQGGPYPPQVAIPSPFLGAAEVENA